MRFKREHFTNHGLLKVGSLVRFFYLYGEDREVVTIYETRCILNMYGDLDDGYEKLDEDSYKLLKMYILLEKIDLNVARRKYKNSNFISRNLSLGEYFIAYSLSENKKVFCSASDTLVEIVQGKQC